jgi:hypothetical protein
MSAQGTSTRSCSSTRARSTRSTRAASPRATCSASWRRGLVFGERSSVVVDPAEERIRSEFAGVRRSYIPLHAVLRVDEVEKQGVSKISRSRGATWRSFPCRSTRPAAIPARASRLAGALRLARQRQPRQRGAVEADGTCVMLDCGLGLREIEARLAARGPRPGRRRCHPRDSRALRSHRRRGALRGAAPHPGAGHGRHGAGLSRPAAAAAGADQRARALRGGRPLRSRPCRCRTMRASPASSCSATARRGSASSRISAAPPSTWSTAWRAATRWRWSATTTRRCWRVGPYPAALKRRVGGDLGHLSNSQAAVLLAALDTARLRHVVALHLSETNNTPALARAALAGVLGCAPADEVGVADQARAWTGASL